MGQEAGGPAHFRSCAGNLIERRFNDLAQANPKSIDGGAVLLFLRRGSCCARLDKQRAKGVDLSGKGAKSSQMSKGLLIHNLKAKVLDEELLPKLVSTLGDVISVSIEQLGGGANALHYAQANHCDWIAAAGGDGTVEGVAAALVGTTFPLGIIPVGTFNNFARSLGLPIDPIEACQVILAENAKPTDVGLANGKPFFECLGSGLDAALYPLGEEIKSGRISRLIKFIRRAYRYRRQKFVLTLDRAARDALARGTTNESRHLVHLLERTQTPTFALTALMLIVSNGPYFGMNFAVAPHERMDDGLFTVSVFSRYSKLQLWWHFASMAFGRRAYSPKSIAFRVAKLTVGGPRKLPVHLDGSTQNDLWPVEVECKKGAIRVFRKTKQ
jgi:diacylglycerol kinase (ATP)